MILDPNNRWVKLRDCIPWDELSESYYKTLCSNLGRPAKDARIVIGAVIIKHKLSISDEETVEQIRENPKQAQKRRGSWVGRSSIAGNFSA